MQNRKGAFSTSRFHQLIEARGQLGYEVDGRFVPVCDLRGQRRFTPDQRGRERDMLEEFLDGTPDMRKDAAAGLLTFSLDAAGGIYCHTTPEYYKCYCAPGSADRMRAIDNWMKVNLTPEQYAEEKKRPVKKLEGAQLDAWAEARAAENERAITSLKRNGGHAPKQFARIETAQPSA